MMTLWLESRDQSEGRRTNLSLVWSLIWTVGRQIHLKLVYQCKFCRQKVFTTLVILFFSVTTYVQVHCHYPFCLWNRTSKPQKKKTKKTNKIYNLHIDFSSAFFLCCISSKQHVEAQTVHLASSGLPLLSVILQVFHFYYYLQN